MKSKEILRILEDLQSWDFEKNPLLRLDKEDTEHLIELLLRQKDKIMYQRKRYQTHREEAIDDAKKRYRESKRKYYETHKEELKKRRLMKICEKTTRQI